MSTSGYIFDNCAHDDRARLVQMVYDMATPGLDAVLGWNLNLSAADDYCTWSGVRCYASRAYQIEIQNQGELRGIVIP